MALIVALAAFAVCLGIYVVHDALRACGCDVFQSLRHCSSRSPFALPAIDVSAFVRAIKAKWPVSRLVGCYIACMSMKMRQVAAEALHVFETEAGFGR